MKAHGCGQTILQVRFNYFFFKLRNTKKKLGSWVESEVAELFILLYMLSILVVVTGWHVGEPNNFKKNGGEDCLLVTFNLSCPRDLLLNPNS